MIYKTKITDKDLESTFCIHREYFKKYKEDADEDNGHPFGWRVFNPIKNISKRACFACRVRLEDYVYYEYFRKRKNAEDYAYQVFRLLQIPEGE